MRIISGKYGRRRFEVPRNIKARPTTDFARENLFNVLSNRLDFEGMEALDLFSGTGAVSFELASRGCSKVVSVEIYSFQYTFIKKVIHELKADEIIAIKGDVFKYIAASREQFDFIFADPPYALPEMEKLPRLILTSTLLRPGGTFVLEHSKENDFSTDPHFEQMRNYGSVHFSIFRQGEEKPLSNEGPKPKTTSL